MAIVDDYAAIAAELRRIQAEQASQEQPSPALSVTGPYATVRADTVGTDIAASAGFEHRLNANEILVVISPLRQPNLPAPPRLTMASTSRLPHSKLVACLIPQVDAGWG